MRVSWRLFDVQGKLANTAGYESGQAGSFDSVSAKTAGSNSFLQNLMRISAISRHAVCDHQR
jgi:hypothetical protein